MSKDRSGSGGPLKVLIGILSLVLVVLLVIAVTLKPKDSGANHLSVPKNTTTAPTTEPTTEPTTQPTEPPVQKIATATVASTGDLLLHDRVIASGLDSATNTYNYDNIFTYLTEYAQQADYSVANMEGTLCGTDSGYSYTGYPCFNSPDAIVDAAKKAGFDMLLTANNHSYDTRNAGFMRTQQVIAERGFDYIGTIPNTDTKNYIVKDINGIQVGMTCYTYETGKNSKGNKTLNGIGLTAQDGALINSFDYEDLDSFYTQLSGEMEEMKADGAECIVLYIHWGDEYKTTPNSWQTRIAQALCNLGVDIIVGGHAHVVQPVDLLVSENDPTKTTLCLYSMGNAVANMRKSSNYSAHIEDGMLFYFTLAKYSDGSVVIESTDVLPTWVNRHNSSETGKEVFAIIPLDPEKEDWKTAFDLTDSTLAQAEASLARSLEIVSQGLEKANAYYSQKQAEHEAAIGVEG